MNKLSFCLRTFFFLIILLASSIFYYYKTQVIYTGTLTIDNTSLSSPIHIHTDNKGFVHIKAETQQDAFFAMGVAHARDRLWQMEFFRRLGSGTLSEILGEKALPIDKAARTFGFRYTAEQDVLASILNREHSLLNNLMSRYVEGINYWASNHYRPIEFLIVGDKFKDWTVVDSYTVYRLLTYIMTVDHMNEVLNTLIHDILGKEYFDILYSSTMYDYPFMNETVVTADEIREMGLAGDNDKPVNLPDGKIEIPHLKVKVSSIKRPFTIDNEKHEHLSNSWVVSGNHTSTGKPMLSSDPHLGNSIPGQHYIIKLYIKNTDDIVIGTAPPGIPFIIIGNNKYHAYCFTTDNRDIADFVQEKLDNDNITLAKHYYVDNDKLPLEIRFEKIYIKGKSNPFEFEVKSTRNGPIIEEFIKEFSNTNLDYIFKSDNPQITNALTLNIPLFKKPLNLHYFHSIMFAKTSNEFLTALDKGYYGPSFALTWANINGEIGYTPIGHFLLKDNPQQVFAQGYSSSYPSPMPFIPRNETPVLINPKKGYIATANGSPVPFNYKYFSSHYSYHFRFVRISRLLENIISKRKYTVQDALNVLSDKKDLLCEIMLPKLITVLKDKGVTSHNSKYFTLLSEFDCVFTKESKAASFYYTYEYKLLQYILLKNKQHDIHIGFDNKNDVRGLFTVHTMFFALYNIISDLDKYANLPTCKFFNTASDCSGYVKDVYDGMNEFLIEEKFVDASGDIKKWSDIHFHYYSHQFQSIPILKQIFTRSVSTDGNRNTIKVSKTKYSMDNPFTSVHSANMKYINDLSDITRPYICLDTGNSGNVFSKYYDNLMHECERNELTKIIDYDFKDESKDLIIKPKY